jgi:hypothetical protein
VDGVALLTYSGIGRVYDTQVSYWVYRTLRGLNLPLERYLERVWAAGRRRLLQHAKVAGSHLFIASAIREKRHYLYFIDVLRTEAPQVIRHEPRTRGNIVMSVTGSGQEYALKYERRRITQICRVVKQYERNHVTPRFIASQLADLNVQIGKHASSASDTSVSRESVVVFRSRAKDRPGGQHWCFDESGMLTAAQGLVIPTIANGFPVTEIAAVLMAEMTKRLNALPPGLSGKQFEGVSVIPDPEIMDKLTAAIPDTPDEEFR